ncbi:hypothetical protein NP233_g6496 [Leucocoprinus birnbaumii]|uniref:Uncharacterized protein n=1 Tax=Leucocoprinus birnbaumii TaxID=56174 RepID=A0AAD5YVQ6_9AGAR|nr:hypothetical protein NP233_g6496 [Leucocoprinus birnbaumii]
MFVRAKLTYTTEISLKPDPGITSLVLVPLPYTEDGIEDIGPHLHRASIGSAIFTLSKEEQLNPLTSPFEAESVQAPLTFSSSLSSIDESEQTEEFTQSETPQQEDESVYEKGSLRTIYGMGKSYRVFQSYDRLSIERPPKPRSRLTFPDASLYAHVYEGPHSQKCAQLWVYLSQSQEWKRVMQGHVEEFQKKSYHIQWKDGYGVSWVHASK